ncbi:sorbosone dehydrogenase [Pedobacter psychrophilus]|uniref:Sorbosone dehydrogenase n=1 Tax=Pedobacter psychrophilus TaxID=1826909 RepID=A0A179DIJ0_9SPHI|nr:PQQ-dependent sugar dehydrogenase [Pedobacter psychrophilus]OAQ40855.1 sorbosone dehydrogenase [Pedobacter psychrophilus]
MKKPNYKIFSLIAAVILMSYSFTDRKDDIENAGLTLPAGFSAATISENIGRARHIAINKNGEVYVRLAKLVDGKGTLFLTDDDKDGKFEVKFSFGDFSGTGIYIKNGYLYASSNEEVFRFKLDKEERVIDPNNPEKIITGLIAKNQHETKSLVVDNQDNVYVNIGAYSNSCQVKDRSLESPGMVGCPILDSAGGIWKFKADKLNQSYNNGEHYATGLRNVVGLDWNNATNSLFVMQHGRDNLNSSWPKLYTEKQSADLPAECLYQIKKGDNAGWPYMYYDQIQKKKILAPEYGGDGKKEADSKFINPTVAFPGHMAPNGLLFYTGNQFPEKYKNGAFIAFHGSWNRSPLPQEGYYVAFVPFKDGKPSGDWEVFAKGFAGVEVINSTRQAQHRPCGLAQGPDGSLFVTDDVKGSVYKISYNQ